MVIVLIVINMSDKEKVTTFKHVFQVPTKDFKKSVEKELTIHTYIKDSHLLFSLTIPSYIYNKIFGTDQKYIDGFIEKEYISPFSGRKVRFKNKLQNEVFFDLVGRFDEMCCDAMQIQAVIDAEKNKVILVKFSKKDIQDKDRLNFATKGRQLASRFQYFICYKRKVKFFDGEKTIYESIERNEVGIPTVRKGFRFKHYYDPLEKEFDVLLWTQEKEDFFKNIEEGFIELNNKLDEFFGKLTDDKVEKLIATHNQSNLLPAYKKKDAGVVN